MKGAAVAVVLGLLCAAPAAGQREVMPNGLRVLVNPIPATEVMTATVLLNIPAATEREEQQGIRFLTQRMLLRGTETEAGDAMGERLAAVGGTITVNVALDYTEITVRAPSDGFDVAMELLAMALLQPAFPPEELETERRRAIEAIRAGRQDPFQRTYQALREELYGKESYGRWAVGSLATAARLSRMDVVLFYREHYRPERAVLSIAGGVEAGQALRAARRDFGAWRGEGRPAEVAPVKEAPLTSSEITVRELSTPRLHLMMGFPAPAVGQPGYYPMQVIDSLLGGGSTARLPKALREERGLAYDVSSFYPTLAGESHFGIYAVTEDGNLGEVKGVVLKELQRLRDEPVPAGELTRAKRSLLGAYALSRQDSASVAYSAAWYELLGCPQDFPNRYREEVNAVTAQQVQETARRVIHHFILALTVPSA